VTQTYTPSKTFTPTATFTITPTATPTIDPNCNRVTFVADITVPDGTVINTGDRFTKTWRFENAGTCTWTTFYKFAFVGGDQLGAVDFIPLPRIVTPGESVDLSIALNAPQTPGVYRGNWSFEDPKGTRFGLGASSTGEIWVQVNVVAGPTSTATLTPLPTPTSTATLAPPYLEPGEVVSLDFIGQACSAAWTVEGTTLPCPAFDSPEPARLSYPALEDGSVSAHPALRVGPAAGTISGIYPEVVIQPGDRFRAIASCEAQATACSALFRLSYQESAGLVTDLWAVGEFFDRGFTKIDVDLSPLAGRSVKLILNVTLLDQNPLNNALWVSPGVYRIPLPTATPTLQPSATATITAAPTATAAASATPAAPPEGQPPSLLEAIQQFFDDLFRQWFGG
jgi:hypothetical protein